MTPDAMLARVARRTLLVSAVLSACALILGGLAAAAGVVGGAALAVMSLLLLKRGTARLADPARPAGPGLGLVLVRYALLGFAAYVMVAVLRLHPIGLLAGASAIVIAIAIEAATSRRPS